MKIVSNPAFAEFSEFLHTLPARFDIDGETIYQGRNVLKRFQIGEVPVIVKRFKKPFWLNRVVYTFFRSGKADRSYENSLEMLRRGISTPAPIGYLTLSKGGLLYQSFYVCMEAVQAKKIETYYYEEPENESLYEQVANYIAQMHAHGVWHEDLSPGNLLIRREGETCEFFLVDANRMSFGPISLQKGMTNFSRFCPTRRSSELIAKYYARAIGQPEEEVVAFIARSCDQFYRSKIYHWERSHLKKYKGFWSAYFGPVQYYQLLRFYRLKLTRGRKVRFLKKEAELYRDFICNTDPRQLLLDPMYDSPIAY